MMICFCPYLLTSKPTMILGRTNILHWYTGNLVTFLDVDLCQTPGCTAGDTKTSLTHLAGSVVIDTLCSCLYQTCRILLPPPLKIVKNILAKSYQLSSGTNARPLDHSGWHFGWSSWYFLWKGLRVVCNSKWRILFLPLQPDVDLAVKRDHTGWCLKLVE